MTTTTLTTRSPLSGLRRLYSARFVFAIIWAGLLLTTASSLGAFAIVLLILYPAFDVVSAVVDGRYIARGGAPATGLYVNMAISAVAALGLAVAGAHDIAAVLRVWGLWAIVAGLVQLGVALARRGSGGQWPMIASGAISVAAGTSFILSADQATSLKNIAGYAVLGGVFFLVSALLSGRSTDARRA